MPRKRKDSQMYRFSISEDFNLCYEKPGHGLHFVRSHEENLTT